MTAQPSLFRPPPAVPTHALTDRQRLAWDHIRSIPGGVTADEVGAWLHAHREPHMRPHGLDERCEWCAQTGLDVIRSKALKGLVIKHHGGKIEARDPRYRASVPTSQLADLPVDLFGGA